MRTSRGKHVRRSSGRSKAVGVVVAGLLALGTAGVVQQASASPAKREAASLTSAARNGAEDTSVRRPRRSPTATPSGSPTASQRSKGRWGWSKRPRPARTLTATPRPTAPSVDPSTPVAKPPMPSPSRPSGPTATMPAAPTGTAAQQVLAQVNQARAENGLAPLQMSAPLVAAARAHNRVMAGGCGLSHQCPGEPGLGARISAQGVTWSAVAENIGTGGPVRDEAAAIAMAKRLTSAMLAETPPNDGHRRNILGSRYKYIGIEVYVDGSNRLWMTQDFSG